MRRLIVLTFFLALAACSREPVAPPPANGTADASRTATLPTQSTSIAPAGEPSYDDAVIWLKTTPRFSFVLDEGGFRAEGEMTRTRVGAETVTFRAGGEEWRGEISPQGLVWKRRNGEAWSEALPPPFAGRLYQRITLGLDPQKKEGVAQLASREGPISVFRFTDANSGEIHQLRVRADGSVERITIGKDIDLQIDPR